MSGIAHTPTTLPLRPRSHRLAWIAAAIALVAIALTVALIVLVDNDSSSPAAVTPASAVAPPSDVRYDGGPEEGSASVSQSSSTTRYDGGPEEGTRGPGN